MGWLHYLSGAKQEQDREIRKRNDERRQMVPVSTYVPEKPCEVIVDGVRYIRADLIKKESSDC